MQQPTVIVTPPAGGVAVTADGTAPHGPRHGWRHFALHYLEMLVAMAVGMFVVGAAMRGLLAALDLSYVHAERPQLAALEMATTMSVGMTVWMRYRGHSWARTLEMDAAMFAPALVLLPLLWADVISGDALFDLLHLLMLPAMLAVMLLRRDEYTAAHVRHGTRWRRVRRRGRRDARRGDAAAA